MPAWFYILCLRSGVLYAGATTDLARRHQQHIKGIASHTTKRDPPLGLVYSEPHPTFSDARLREAQVKRWSRAKKEALVAGHTRKLKALARSRDHR